MDAITESANDMVKNLTHQEALDIIAKMPESAVGSPLCNALLAKIAGE